MDRRTSATTTPLLPLELPPFALNPLLPLAFPPTPSPSSSSTPSSSTPASPPSRFSTSFSQSLPPSAEQPHIRSVDAAGSSIWIGASDARVRRYHVVDTISTSAAAAGGAGADDSTGGRPRTPIQVTGRRTPTSPSSRLSAGSPSSSSGWYKEQTALELVEETTPTSTGTRKAADKIALMERLGKAVILSEGIMTFHSLPSLQPLPVHQFPSMKGVTTIALDESELSFPSTTGPPEMHLVAIRRRTVHLLRITSEGASQVKELPLRGGALLSVFRNLHVCIADQENYFMVDLENQVAWPLVPISQSPSPPTPPPTQSTGAPSTTPPPPVGGPDPRQRPAIACVGEKEFLIASHTGATTLGVFVTEQGEPCRGTLEWGSNLRSLVVDNQYTLALLFNHTIEVHNLHTQEIVQVLQLPRAPSPSSPPSSLSSSIAFQPRALIRVWGAGLDLGPAGGGIDKIDLVDITISSTKLPLSTVFDPKNPPRTPTKRTRGDEVTLYSGGEKETKKKMRARVLLVGKNGLHAIAPLTLVVQADALIEKGRVEEAVKLADHVVSSSSSVPSFVDQEAVYVYLRCGYHLIAQTLFQDAFSLFSKAHANPILVVRMFPDLIGTLLSGAGEVVKVPKGVEDQVREGISVDDFIMANLNHNYSPHLKPDVENAASGIELRAMLGTTAKDCLRRYLQRWRKKRRAGGNAGVDSRKVDIVVDTTLVRLLVEEKQVTELKAILHGANDCVLQEVEQSFLQPGLFELLANEWLKKGEQRKVLDIWIKTVDGVYDEPAFLDGVVKVEELLWQSKDKDLVTFYGLWLLGHDRTKGLKLFTDPKQTISFDTRGLFARIRTVDEDAADLFLESVVLQKRDNDSGLHADLIERYIIKLSDLLGNTETKTHLREQEIRFVSQNSSKSQASTFLSFLTDSYDPTSSFAKFDRVRLKTILFLAKSNNYDLPRTKKDLDEMEVNGLRGLTLERSVVYGKLRLDRQALSLLLHTLQDLNSAETYCHQSGDPLLVSDISAAASRLSLTLPKSRNKGRRGSTDGKERRRPQLARLLVELCLVGGAAGEVAEDRSGTSREKQIAGILETQALHLDAIDVLPLLPAHWSIQPLTPFLSRSLRRSLHDRHEASLLKALASSQNFTVSDRLSALRFQMGPTVQQTDDEGNGDLKTAQRTVVSEIKLDESKEKSIVVELSLS